MPECSALDTDPFDGTVGLLCLVFDEELVVRVLFNVNFTCSSVCPGHPQNPVKIHPVKIR